MRESQCGKALCRNSLLQEGHFCRKGTKGHNGIRNKRIFQLSDWLKNPFSFGCFDFYVTYALAFSLLGLLDLLDLFGLLALLSLLALLGLLSLLNLGSSLLSKKIHAAPFPAATWILFPEQHLPQKASAESLSFSIILSG